MVHYLVVHLPILKGGFKVVHGVLAPIQASMGYFYQASLGCLYQCTFSLAMFHAEYYLYSLKE